MISIPFRRIVELKEKENGDDNDISLAAAVNNLAVFHSLLVINNPLTTVCRFYKGHLRTIKLYIYYIYLLSWDKFKCL